MPVINRIAAYADELAGWRRHLHQIPELDFDLFETAAFVTDRLREIGVDEIHGNIAKTGIVALIRGGAPGPVIGLRADMDALPIVEATGLPHASRNPGRMHACGHDGHTVTLLGAARYLSETRNFAGTVALIFQPSEEMNGGAEVMVREGIMDRFAIDRVFALHNVPGPPLGAVATTPGPIMASSDEFRIAIRGRGGHAAYPHECIDPIAPALQIGQALQTLVSRRADPLARLVVSLTTLEAGTARNVVPEIARLGGTVRALDETLRQATATELRRLAETIAAAHGCTAEVEHHFGYPVTVNDPESTAFAARVAAEIVGPEHVEADRPAEMGAEDFAYMLQSRPGAYIFLGTGPGAGLHHPAYDYNDAATPIGASWFARLVETAQPLNP
jgi:hippurate hydrolase